MHYVVKRRFANKRNVESDLIKTYYCKMNRYAIVVLCNLYDN